MAAPAAGGSAGSGGAVIGGAVGGGAALLIGGAIIVILTRRRRAARQVTIAKGTTSKAAGGSSSGGSVGGVGGASGRGDGGRGDGGAVNPMLVRVSVDVTMSGVDGEGSVDSPLRRASNARMMDSAAGAPSEHGALANASGANARAAARAAGDEAFRAPAIFGGPDDSLRTSLSVTAVVSGGGSRRAFGTKLAGGGADSPGAPPATPSEQQPWVFAPMSAASAAKSSKAPDYLSRLNATPDSFLKPDVLDGVAARRAASTRNLVALSGVSSSISALKTVSAAGGNRSALNTKGGASGVGGNVEAGSRRVAGEAEASAGLPDGWTAVWSKSQQTFYWRRAGDNATSWTKPTEP